MPPGHYISAHDLSALGWAEPSLALDYALRTPMYLKPPVCETGAIKAPGAELLPGLNSLMGSPLVAEHSPVKEQNPPASLHGPEASELHALLRIAASNCGSVAGNAALTDTPLKQILFRGPGKSMHGLLKRSVQQGSIGLDVQEREKLNPLLPLLPGSLTEQTSTRAPEPPAKGLTNMKACPAVSEQQNNSLQIGACEGRMGPDQPKKDVAKTEHALRQPHAAQKRGRKTLVGFKAESSAAEDKDPGLGKPGWMHKTKRACYASRQKKAGNEQASTDPCHQGQESSGALLANTRHWTGAKDAQAALKGGGRHLGAKTQQWQQVQRCFVTDPEDALLASLLDQTDVWEGKPEWLSSELVQTQREGLKFAPTAVSREGQTLVGKRVLFPLLEDFQHKDKSRTFTVAAGLHVGRYVRMSPWLESLDALIGFFHAACLQKN